LRTGQVFQYWNEIEELIVVCVGKPAADWNGMLWVEDVRGWRIVNDDRVFQVTADLRKVL